MMIFLDFFPHKLRRGLPSAPSSSRLWSLDIFFIG
jgi:hypothetical protein